MNQEPSGSIIEQRRIVTYLDSVQAKVASLRQLQFASGEELSAPLHFGNATQSALLPSVLRPSGGAFKGES